MTVDNLARLYLETLRDYREYRVDTPAARDFARDTIAKALDGCEAAHFLDDGKRGGIVVHRTEGRICETVQRGIIQLARDDEAYAWAGEVLAELAPFDVTFESMVDARHERLLPLADVAGLQPRLRWLTGTPALALDGLRASTIRRDGFDDLRVAPLEKRQIAAVLAMMQHIFTSQKESGMVSPHIVFTPERQARLDAFVENGLHKQIADGTVWSVVRGDAVVGQCGFWLRDDPLLGQSGGHEHRDHQTDPGSRAQQAALRNDARAYDRARGRHVCRSYSQPRSASSRRSHEAAHPRLSARAADTVSSRARHRRAIP